VGTASKTVVESFFITIFMTDLMSSDSVSENAPASVSVKLKPEHNTESLFVLNDQRKGSGTDQPTKECTSPVLMRYGLAAAYLQYQLRLRKKCL